MFSFFKGKKRVLVVEDDPSIQEMVAMILRVTGFEVTVAVDGEEGVAQAIKLKPDLILMDIMLPRLGGIDAVADIRRHPDLKTVPIIMCTARTQVSDIEQSLKAGANDYLMKPFEMAALTEKVSKFIKPGS